MSVVLVRVRAFSSLFTRLEVNSFVPVKALDTATVGDCVAAVPFCTDLSSGEVAASGEGTGQALAVFLASAHVEQPVWESYMSGCHRRHATQRVVPDVNAS